MTKNIRFSPASEKGRFDGLVDEGKYLRQSLLYKQILPRTPSRQIRSLPTYHVGPRKLFTPLETCLLFLMGCNLLSINDLRLRKITYEIINLFLQNEPNFRKSQMNVSDLLTRECEQMDTWSSGKNEPKTNPNEPKTNPNFKKGKMNVTTCLTMNYEQ
jgi:hypothetical protein